MNDTENIRQNPLLRILFPFMIGVILAENRIAGEWFEYVICGLFCAIILILLTLRKWLNQYSLRIVQGSIILIAWFFAGYLFTSIKSKAPSFPIDQDVKLTYVASLTENPGLGRNSFKAVAKLLAVLDDNKLVGLDNKVVFYFAINQKAAKLKYGDKVLVNVKLQDIRNRGNPGEFDFAGFMAKKGILQSAFIDSMHWKKISGFDGRKIIRLALNLRYKLLSTYVKYGIQGQELAVVSALTLGYKEELNEPTRKVFSDSGAMHILAVSGLHVGIVQLILNFILSFLNRNRGSRIIKTLIIIIVLWFYALITGMSPSVVRAAIMFTLIQVGISFKQDISIFNIVATTALVVLIINPILLYDLGFQYSYLALTGILFFFPRVYPLLKSKYWLIDKVWALLVASFSAQLALAPLSIYYFGQFPNFFLLTNLLVIPYAFAILISAIALYALSFFDSIAMFLGKGIQAMLGFLLDSLEFIQELPGSVSENIYLDRILVLLWYLVIISLSLFFISKHRQYIYLLLSGIVVILALGVSRQYKIQSSQRLAILNVSKSTAIYARQGCKSIVLCDSTFINSHESKSFHLNKIFAHDGINAPVFVDIDNCTESVTSGGVSFYTAGFLQFDTLTFAIISDEKFKRKKSDIRMNVDYLIVRNCPFIQINELCKLFQFKEVIIDGSNPLWLLEKLMAECAELGVVCRILGSSGAKDISLSL